ncbi:paired amphipathic helix protein Sin3-like protein 2 isoform X1 [Tanacetum coccineum]
MLGLDQLNDRHRYAVSSLMDTAYWMSESVSSNVASLFHDHPELLDEFTGFWPDASAATCAHHTSLPYQTYPRREIVMAIC